MNIVKFLSTEKLVEYLDEELRIFLNAKEIYEINQYGWLIDDRPDPEYLGLAMWQTDPPIRQDKSPAIPESPGSQITSQTDMGIIFKTGLEFEELMKSARHSIGLTYLYHKDTDATGHCFNYHFQETVMKLGMASDRLREFFIDAFAAFLIFDIQEQATSAPPSSKEQHQLFCLPFQQTRDKLAENPDFYEELLASVEKMIPLVEQSSFHRAEGHDRTNQKFLVENEFSMIVDNIAQGTDYRERQEPILARETVTDTISEWYKLLINTSNEIFLAEYLLRNFETPVPTARLVINH